MVNNYKRRRYRRKPGPKKPPMPPKMPMKKGSLVSLIKRISLKPSETKSACASTSQGTEISNNGLVTFSNTLLTTTTGVNDPTTTTANSRIGDSIIPRGLSIRLALELNERYSDVTFRIMIIKSAKGDVPSTSTLFNGLASIKALDTLNTERFTIIAQKFCKITSPNVGTVDRNFASSQLIQTTFPTGVYVPTLSGSDVGLSRATKFVKMWIPGRKLCNQGDKLIYENNSSQPKFYDYHAMVMAFSNYSTSIIQTFYVGRCSEFVYQFYFKDP